MKTFEEYLKEKHSETYMGTDDSMPEAFDNWVSGLDIDDTIDYADNFITTLLEKQEREISMLRQWLNEDRITDPTKMITNDDIKHWLKPHDKNL